MKLSHAAQIVQVPLQGIDADFTGISIDTRTLKPGELFIAFKGENFDGHDFIAAAEQKHAAALLVEHAVNSTLPQLLVDNAIQALGQLAAFHRQQFTLPLIGVTGSCGKTTVKTMLASILQQCGSVLFSASSFNNAIGVPLSLLNLTSHHQYAVIEMGMNHFGEIAYLTQLAKPTIAVITNAAAAHLEGIGDVAGVARAKGEIYQGLAAAGTAIINADDAYAEYWRALAAPRTIIDFGMENNAAVTAKDVTLDATGKAEFTLCTPCGQVIIKLPFLGRHNVNNALAAAAAAIALNIPLTAIQLGLTTLAAVSKRLCEYTGLQGAHIIDDSYNANPLSVKAAIEVLAHQADERILVLGDMKELGANAADYHYQLGVTARTLGIEKLYGFGELSRFAVQGFGEAAQHFTDQAALITQLKTLLHPQLTLLIKGSNSMHMDRVAMAIRQEA